MLILLALGLTACASTGEGSGDARNFFNFGDTGNIQIRSGIAFEVCTTGNDGYVQGAIAPDGRYCTTLGQPGAVHSDMLRHMTSAAHTLWVRHAGEEEWFTIIIPRCNTGYGRRGPCVAEEFDLMLYEDRWACVTRWERHPACRTGYYGRGRYQ